MAVMIKQKRIGGIQTDGQNEGRPSSLEISALNCVSLYVQMYRCRGQLYNLTLITAISSALRA